MDMTAALLTLVCMVFAVVPLNILIVWLVWRAARRAPGVPPDGQRVWPWILAVALLCIATPVGIFTWHHIQKVRKAEAWANRPRQLSFFKAGSSTEETGRAAAAVQDIPEVVDVETEFHSGLPARPGSPVDTSFVRPTVHPAAMGAVRKVMLALGYKEFPTQPGL
jgi:hypothetical protein